MAKKCLAPQSIGGLGGKLVENAPCSETSDDILFNEIEALDLIDLRSRVAEELANIPELANITSFLSELLAVQQTDNDEGIVRSFIRVESASKPTPGQLESLCRTVSNAILNATISGFTTEQCQLLEISDGSNAQSTPSNKRQSSSPLMTTIYLQEFEAENINDTIPPSSITGKSDSPLISAGIILLVPLALLLI
jgi:hypothetical protein